MELFVVEPSRGRWPDWELVADEIDAVLRGTLPLDERLAEQARIYADAPRRVGPSGPHHGHRRQRGLGRAPRWSRSGPMTARPSLPVTAALFDLDLDVVAARVSTFGHEVVDAFYVRDRPARGQNPAIRAHRVALEHAVAQQAMQAERYPTA